MTLKGRAYWKSWDLWLICCLCQLFAGLMVACIPVYCLFLANVSPESSPLSSRHTAGLACYFYVNLCLGWIQFRHRLVFNDVVTKAAVGSVDCVPCGTSVPSGSYHCPVCDLCVWRRDHHCFFLGGCVGFSNLKSFICFCLNACLGCAYALVAVLCYLSADFHPLWSRQFAYYAVPYTFARWLVGDVASRHLAAVVLSNALVAAFTSTLFMFSLQVYLVFVSKTSYELFRKGSSSAVDSPARSSWRNFERTLGNKWILHLFCPVFTVNSRGLLHRPKKDCLNEAMKYV